MTLLASAIAKSELSSAFGQRFEVIAVAVAISLVIFELIRRKRLMERYAILWLLAGVTILVLALWQGLLTKISHAVGISYPPSTLFAITFLFVVLMLIHFSLTVSRISDQNKVLAQRLALLQARVDALRGALGAAQLSDGGERSGEAPREPATHAQEPRPAVLAATARTPPPGEDTDG